MRDQDLLLDRPDPQFGSGVIGVCDVCGRRQAVIVLQKERFKLCVIDFLNKTWATSGKAPGAPLPIYRSERIWYTTRAVPGGKAPAVMLSPTKMAKRPVVLITPDVYGLTTTLLDAAIHFAREGFEVMLPDVSNTPGIGATSHLALRLGLRIRGGIRASDPRVLTLVSLYRDALTALRGREMVDPEKSAVFGASYGGALAAMVAAQEPKVGALVLAYPMPILPAATMVMVNAPTLILSGTADARSHQFVSQARATGQPGAAGPGVAEFSGARHHFLARDLPSYQLENAESAWKQSVAFLRQSLLPPPPKPPSPPSVKPAPPPAAAVPEVSPGAVGPPPAAPPGAGRPSAPRASGA
jgi:dienelactone hydrolase